ncbi:MAG: hypothetical protein ACREKH_20115 [Candidatus Rokuibacteriota bacterium]
MLASHSWTGVRLPALATIGITAALAAGCTQREPSAVGPVDEDLHGTFVFVGENDSFPEMRYASGAVTLNDRCPVRRVKLNPNLRPLFVNGRPVGFC